jgi:hypothetical protein
MIFFGGLYFGTEDKATGRYTDYGGITGKSDLNVPWTNIKVRQAMNKAINRMWEDLLQMADPVARDAQLRKIGNYKFEPFESIPLFYTYIEVVVDPKIVEDWPFSGWDGGDLGHTWLVKACKQEKPCR